MSYNRTTRYDFGDVVTIDNDPVHCRVLAVLIRQANITYEVAWMNSGEARSAWIEDWRLSPVVAGAVGF